MKKLWLVVAAGVILFAYHMGQKVANASAELSTVSPVPLVARAFSATGAMLTEYEVHDWTTLQNKALTLSQMESIGGKVAKSLANSTRPTWKQTSAEESAVMYAYHQGKKGTTPSLQVTVELMSMKFPNIVPQTVLVIRELVTTTSDQTMENTYQRVQSAIMATGGLPHINVTMVGERRGLLSSSARANVVKRTFAFAGGTPLQGMQDAYTTSTSGEVPGIMVPSIRSGRQNLNLQVALHKRIYQKDTKVLVGSPIITIEY